MHSRSETHFSGFQIHMVVCVTSDFVEFTSFQGISIEHPRAIIMNCGNIAVINTCRVYVPVSVKIIL